MDEKRSWVLVPVVLWVSLMAAPVLAETVYVDICHATGVVDEPYSKVTVVVESVDDANDLNGHGDHADDIWAPYSYDGVDYPGQGDLSILALNCHTTATVFSDGFEDGSLVAWIVSCASDEDCAPPDPWCDLSSNMCVECLTGADCPSGVCDPDTNTCVVTSVPSL